MGGLQWGPSETDDTNDNVPFIFVDTNRRIEAFALNYLGQ